MCNRLFNDDEIIPFLGIGVLYPTPPTILPHISGVISLDDPISEGPRGQEGVPV